MPWFGSHSYLNEFIRENRPMMAIGRMMTYTGIGSTVSVLVMYIMRDTLLKLFGGG